MYTEQCDLRSWDATQIRVTVYLDLSIITSRGFNWKLGRKLAYDLTKAGANRQYKKAAKW
jgi:hypothetical protein